MDKIKRQYVEDPREVNDFYISPTLNESASEYGDFMTRVHTIIDALPIKD